MARIADQRRGAMLGGVEARRIERDDAEGGILKRRPRAGGKILQPRADGEHEVGFGGERVGRAAADDADRADVQAVIPGQAGAPGNGLGDGDGDDGHSAKSGGEQSGSDKLAQYLDISPRR